VPLSEHEQRQLEQIEQALYRDDPKFGRLVRSSDPRVHYKRKLVQALVGIVAGAGLVAAGAVTKNVYLEAAGAVLLVLALLWAVVNWRQHTARTRSARSNRSRGRAHDRRRSSGGNRTGLMERLEERWRRRQEGGDRQL
jgi:Flp pilus assembly protein TadB